MTTGTCNFPKLKDNVAFSNWKFRVKTLLEERNLSVLSKYDLGDKEKQENDAKARSIIVQCVSDRYLNIINKCNTAADMMKSLEAVFERKSVFNKLHLRKKLISMKTKNNQNLQDHFLQFDNLIAQLETVGSVLDESDKLTHLFLTLPEEYNTVITTLETMSIEKELTLEFVKSRLLDEELKFKENKNGRKEEESSFLTCYKCGKEGHMAYQCDKKVEVRQHTQRGRGRSRNRGRSSYRGNFRSQGQGHVTENTRENDNKEMFVACTENIMTVESSETIFVVDSGATHHFIQEKYERFMINVSDLNIPIQIKIANGDMLYAKKKGQLETYYEDKPITIEGLIVDGIAHNLLSVNELMNKGKSVIFENGQLMIKSEKETYYGTKKGKLHILKLTLKQNQEHESQSAQEIHDSDLWHIKLGHLNRKGLQIMNLPYNTKVCEICMKNKSTRLPFKTVEKPQSRNIGDLIHSDVAGPMKTPTKEGYRYYQTILDDYSHFTQTYLLVNKSEAADNLIKYIREIETEKGLKIKRIRCDNGGEYSSKYLKSFCEEKGIKIEYTVPYSPQMNGKSERLNRTIFNKARTILDESNLPRYLWGHAVLTATYLINRCPSSAIQFDIPAIIFQREMKLNKLKPFGAKGWMVILPRQDKLDPRAKEVRMIGYARNGYKVWDPITDTVIVTRDIRFNEKDIKYRKIQNKEEYEYHEHIQENNENKRKLQEEYQKETTINQERESHDRQNMEQEDTNINTESNTNQLRKREVKLPNHLKDFELYEAYCLINEGDPQNYEEAIKGGWKEAITKEKEALIKMNTWTECDLPKDKKTIETKWIFKTKENNLKKARLVVKGYQLKEDTHFGKNYAPVARISSVRTLLAHSVQKEWNIRQLDVPTAFLNGTIESEVYIKPPEGIKVSENKVLKLNRGLYGLRESPKCWNQRFNNFAKEKGFRRSQHDVCLYIGETINVWMLIYVDDIILTGHDKDIEKVVEDLKKEFQVKDFGLPKSFLGMEILKEENSLKITQKRQIENMLVKFKMEDCKSSATPLTKGFQLDESEPIVTDIPYRQLIGSLMFVATVSRPDISYATSYLSQYLDRPTRSLWIQAKRTLRYLKGTQTTGLQYTKSEINSIETYSDADWAGSHTDRKSVSGSVTLYSGCPVAWFSRKQECVALSTVEAEYVAAATSACDLLYIKGLYSDLNDSNSDVLCILYMDNCGAIQIAKSFENSKRAKHIDIKFHFLKDIVSKKFINIEYVATHNNNADMLTKSLAEEKLSTMKSSLKIV